MIRFGQRETAELLNVKAIELRSVEGVQRKLLEQAQQCAQRQVPLSCYRALDTSHGRVVARHVRVFHARWGRLSGLCGG